MNYLCCREGSIVVDSELIFNNITEIPNASVIAESLKNASSTPGFGLAVNISTIAAAGKVYLLPFKNVDSCKL